MSDLMPPKLIKAIHEYNGVDGKSFTLTYPVSDITINCEDIDFIHFPTDDSPGLVFVFDPDLMAVYDDDCDNDGRIRIAKVTDYILDGNNEIAVICKDANGDTVEIRFYQRINVHPFTC